METGGSEGAASSGGARARADEGVARGGRPCLRPGAGLPATGSGGGARGGHRPAGSGQAPAGPEVRAGRAAARTIRPSEDSRRSRRRRRRGSSPRRGRCTSSSPVAWTPGGRRGHCGPPASTPATWCTTASRYHLTPAGSMVETAAHALGCAVIPAGTAPTEAQVAAAAHFRATAYGGTPSFLKVLLDRAAELGVDLSSLTRASVTAEALPATLRKGARRARSPGPAVVRDRGRRAHRVRDSGDGGAGARRGGHPGDRPARDRGPGAAGRGGGGGGDGALRGVPAPALRDGRPLGHPPRARARAGEPTCGIRGWMGRADQSTKVRGLFVHPSHVAELGRRHPAVRRARLVVTRRADLDAMTLRAEVEPQDRPGLAEALVRTLRELTQLRAEVELVDTGRAAERRKGDRGSASGRVSETVAAPPDRGGVRRPTGPVRS